MDYESLISTACFGDIVRFDKGNILDDIGLLKKPGSRIKDGMDIPD